MRYFIATVTTVLTLCSQTARADHDPVSLACAYHDSLHVVLDAAECNPRSSSYYIAYLKRLDRAADQFANALAIDPYCQRTQFLFDQMRYLHQRIDRLVRHGCRAYDYCTPQWHQADELFRCLELEFACCCDRHRVASPAIHPPVIQPPLLQAPVMYTPRPSVRIPRMGEYSQRGAPTAPASVTPGYEIHRVPRDRNHQSRVAPVNNRPQSNTQITNEMIFRLISGLIR